MNVILTKIDCIGVELVANIQLLHYWYNKICNILSIPGTSSLALWSKKVSQSLADWAINRSSSRDPTAKCTLYTSVDFTAGLEKHIKCLPCCTG